MILKSSQGNSFNHLPKLLNQNLISALDIIKTFKGYKNTIAIATIFNELLYVKWVRMNALSSFFK